MLTVYKIKNFFKNNFLFNFISLVEPRALILDEHEKFNFMIKWKEKNNNIRIDIEMKKKETSYF